MGIFNFFKSSPNKKLEQTSKPKMDITNSFEKLKNEVDQLKAENELWQAEFKKLIEFTNKGRDFEKSDEFLQAIESYIKALDFGEASVELGINNYSHDIDRIIILYGKTKRIENQIAFLQRVISSYPQYRDVKKWAVRLSKLTSGNTTSKDLKPSDITKQVAGNPTIGKRLDDFKNTLPEFNFYHDMQEGMQTLEYLNINGIFPANKAKDHRSFKDSFELSLSKAKIAESQKDFKKAIEAYEKLILEEYEYRQPYERLIIIYRKLKWEEEEIDILNRAIFFFEALKEKQKIYILTLAEKYGMESKALEYLNGDKRIQYFGGLFDLYNPNPTIEKWKLQLEKCIKTKDV